MSELTDLYSQYEAQSYGLSNKNKTNASNTNATNYANLLLAEYQNEFNLEQWNRENEYNMYLWNLQNEYDSPASQMQRYQDAGLNPNLIYSQENTSNGQVQTSTPVRAQVPELKAFDKNEGILNKVLGTIQTGLGLLSGIQDARMKTYQADQIQADTALRKAQAITEGLQQNYLGEKTRTESSRQGYLANQSYLANSKGMLNDFWYKYYNQARRDMLRLQSYNTGEAYFDMLRSKGTNRLMDYNINLAEHGLSENSSTLSKSFQQVRAGNISWSDWALTNLMDLVGGFLGSSTSSAGKTLGSGGFGSRYKFNYNRRY